MLLSLKNKLKNQVSNRIKSQQLVDALYPDHGLDKKPHHEWPEEALKMENVNNLWVSKKQMFNYYNKFKSLTKLTVMQRLNSGDETPQIGVDLATLS